MNENDQISRAEAIEAIEELQLPIMRSSEIGDQFKFAGLSDAREAIKALPSAQPERLTDDDFETIRIHLNAYKESLCDQRRWEEAEEYQRIIDRFMAFASAQPETHEKRTETHACDCVSRKAAIDAISCDIIVTGRQNAEVVAETIGAFVDRIKALPSAQPEVPKCKDCYWWTKQSDSLQGRCDRYGFYPTGYWYCAAARERREG